MKLGDKVTVTGKSFCNFNYFNETATIYDFAPESKHSITVQFSNGTIDAFEQNSVKLV